jgi:hypothetical protein
MGDLAHKCRLKNEKSQMIQRISEKYYVKKSMSQFYVIKTGSQSR